MANPPGRTYLRQWHFLDGDYRYHPTNQEITLAPGTTAVNLEIEDGPCYYAINRGGAAATSHGYISQDGQRMIGALDNLDTLHIHGPTAVVHLQFYREA